MDQERRGQLAQLGLVNRREKDKLILSNLGLIGSVIDRYYPWINDVRWYDDAWSEGYLGLEIAAEKYDRSLGYQFSTYAYPWVRNKVSRYIGSSLKEIRLPAYRQLGISALMKAESLFTFVTGIPPDTDKEIADFLDCNEELVSSIRTSCVSAHVYSYDAPIDGENPKGETRQSYLVDQKIITDTVIGSQDENVIAMWNAIDKLPERQRNILLQRFEGDYSLDEIGKFNGGLTRERVRQIIVRALRKVQRELGIHNIPASTEVQTHYYPPCFKDQHIASGKQIQEFHEIVKEKQRTVQIQFRSQKKEELQVVSIKSVPIRTRPLIVGDSAIKGRARITSNHKTKDINLLQWEELLTYALNGAGVDVEKVKPLDVFSVKYPDSPETGVTVKRKPGTDQILFTIQPFGSDPAVIQVFGRISIPTYGQKLDAFIASLADSARKVTSAYVAKRMTQEEIEAKYGCVKENSPSIFEELTKGSPEMNTHNTFGNSLLDLPPLLEKEVPTIDLAQKEHNKEMTEKISIHNDPVIQGPPQDTPTSPNKTTSLSTDTVIRTACYMWLLCGEESATISYSEIAKRLGYTLTQINYPIQAMMKNGVLQASGGTYKRGKTIGVCLRPRYGKLHLTPTITIEPEEKHDLAELVEIIGDAKEMETVTIQKNDPQPTVTENVGDVVDDVHEIPNPTTPLPQPVPQPDPLAVAISHCKTLITQCGMKANEYRQLAEEEELKGIQAAERLSLLLQANKVLDEIKSELL